MMVMNYLYVIYGIVTKYCSNYSRSIDFDDKDEEKDEKDLNCKFFLGVDFDNLNIKDLKSNVIDDKIKKVCDILLLDYTDDNLMFHSCTQCW